MRTTLTLDDEVASSLRELARQSGQPFKQVVNDALRRGLAEHERPQARRYRLSVAALGLPRSGIDLSRTLALADALEDAALVLKLEARK